MTNLQPRNDDLDASYELVNQLDGALSFLFWLNIFLSIAILYADSLLPQNLRIYPTILFAVSVVVYFVLSQLLRFHYIPRAEKLRRRVMLSNAFQANLTPEKTNLYYNNVVEPSIKRLGANTLENAFFAKHVCEKMAGKERVMVCAYLAIQRFLQRVQIFCSCSFKSFSPANF